MYIRPFLQKRCFYPGIYCVNQQCMSSKEHDYDKNSYVHDNCNCSSKKRFLILHNPGVANNHENVTGFGKTDHNVTFCISRNTVLKKLKPLWFSCAAL